MQAIKDFMAAQQNSCSCDQMTVMIFLLQPLMTLLCWSLYGFECVNVNVLTGLRMFLKVGYLTISNLSSRLKMLF